MVVKTQKKPKAPVRADDTAADVDTPSGLKNEIENLIDELKHGRDEIVRSKAAAALGYLKTEEAVEPLIRALKDAHVYVRHGAAWALGEIKSEKAIPALKEALTDDDEVTRGKAAEALGKIQGN